MDYKLSAGIDFKDVYIDYFSGTVVMVNIYMDSPDKVLLVSPKAFDEAVKMGIFIKKETKEEQDV